MNGFDLISCGRSQILLAPAAYAVTAAGTYQPDITEMVGRGSFFAIVGVVSAGAEMIITLMHSDTLGSGYVPAPVAPIDITPASNYSIIRMGVAASTSKRFVRADYTISGATPSVFVAAIISGFNAVR